MSGNQCAYTGCPEEIVHFTPDHEPIVLGVVCHIKGKRPGAKRYDRSQTEEERRAFDNLILLCTKHHTIIDGDDKTHTVDVLRAMKRAHEGKLLPPPPEISDAAAMQLLPIEARTVIDFVDTFDQVSQDTHVTRAQAQEVLRSPDKTQILTLPNHWLRLSLKRVRVSREFFLMVGSSEVKGKPVIAWALRILPDLAPNMEALSPLEMLKKLTERFGVNVTVGTTTAKFIEHATAESFGPPVKILSFANPFDHAIVHVPTTKCFVVTYTTRRLPPERHEACWVFAIDTVSYRKWLGT